MNLFICKVCDHIEISKVPDKCPVCFAPKTEFFKKNNVFKESKEESREAEGKHIPVVKIIKKCTLIPEEKCTDVLVRIGEELHPMEEKHYIKFIDCYLDKKYVSRIMLTLAMNPSVVFHLKRKGSKVIIIESCKIHGHWMKEVNI